MANLQLAVKGEYFDAMIRGEKTEEYRLCNDYWKKRLVNRKYDRLMAVFYCLICRFDSLFGDSTHATRTTA